MPSVIALAVALLLLPQRGLAESDAQSDAPHAPISECIEIVQPGRYLVYINVSEWARGETAGVLIEPVIAELEEEYGLAT